MIVKNMKFKASGAFYTALMLMGTIAYPVNMMAMQDHLSPVGLPAKASQTPKVTKESIITRLKTFTIFKGSVGFDFTSKADLEAKKAALETESKNLKPTLWAIYGLGRGPKDINTEITAIDQLLGLLSASSSAGSSAPEITKSNPEAPAPTVMPEPGSAANSDVSGTKSGSKSWTTLQKVGIGAGVTVGAIGLIALARYVYVRWIKSDEKKDLELIDSLAAAAKDDVSYATKSGNLSFDDSVLKEIIIEFKAIKPTDFKLLSPATYQKLAEAVNVFGKSKCIEADLKAFDAVLDDCRKEIKKLAQERKEQKDNDKKIVKKA